MVKQVRIAKIDNARGGVGSIEMHHFLEEDEMLSHGTLFAKVVIKPHSSIGWHQHVGNTEPYAIIKGDGVFIDNDESRINVKSGDVCVINVGEYHAIENNTDEDLEMIALVLNEA